MLRERKSMMFGAVILSVLTGLAGSSMAQENPQEYYEKGVELMQEGDTDGAVQSFLKARELAPYVPYVHNALGLAYLQEKENIEDAIASFEQAIRLDPKFVDAYCNLGIAHSSIGYDTAMAEEYYHKAIALKPGYYRAYFGLGWIQIVRNNNPRRSVQDFEIAVKNSPSYAEADFYLGLAYIMSAQKHKALRPISALRSLGKEDLALTLEAVINDDPSSVKEKIIQE